MKELKASEIYSTVKNKGLFRCNQGTIFMPVPGQHRLWRAIAETEYIGLVRSFFDSATQSFLSSKNVSETYKRARFDPHLRITFADQIAETRNLIRLNNGVIDLDSLRLYPFESFDLDFCYALNFSYIANANINVASSFLQFVGSSLGAEENNLPRLLEMLCCIITSLKKKTSFLFYGPSNSGKSVMIEFLARIFFPSSAVSAVPLENFSNNFALADMRTAKIDLCTEVSEDAFKHPATVRAFKQIVARETLVVANKHEKGFASRFDMTLVMCSNRILSIKADDLDAILNRIEVLVFLTGIPQEMQDPHLLEKLWYERDIILSSALNRLPILRSNLFKLTQTISSFNYMQDYWATSVFAKIMDYINVACVKNIVGKVPTKLLYEGYCIFCEENGYSAGVSREQFTKYVKTLTGLKKQKARFGTKTVQAFVGIELRAEYLPEIANRALPVEVVTAAAIPARDIINPFFDMRVEHQRQIERGDYLGDHPENATADCPIYRISCGKEKEI